MESQQARNSPKTAASPAVMCWPRCTRWKPPSLPPIQPGPCATPTAWEQNSLPLLPASRAAARPLAPAKGPPGTHFDFPDPAAPQAVSLPGRQGQREGPGPGSGLTQLLGEVEVPRESCPEPNGSSDPLALAHVPPERPKVPVSPDPSVGSGRAADTYSSRVPWSPRQAGPSSPFVG